MIQFSYKQYPGVSLEAKEPNNAMTIKILTMNNNLIFISIFILANILPCCSVAVSWMYILCTISAIVLKRSQEVYSNSKKENSSFGRK